MISNLTRSLPLPLFSSLVTRMRPTSPVDLTWVPSSACLSKPTMSTTRTSGIWVGTRLTFVHHDRQLAAEAPICAPGVVVGEVGGDLFDLANSWAWSCVQGAVAGP
jgi:hypothetical protein